VAARPPPKRRLRVLVALGVAVRGRAALVAVAAAIVAVPPAAVLRAHGHRVLPPPLFVP
jgi:hypothetical protein